ncbi:hypothetical protein ACFSTD_12890 [Novosphingobium colocasiae]
MKKSTTFEDQGLRYFDNTSHDSSLFFINYSGVTNKQKIEKHRRVHQPGIRCLAESDPQGSSALHQLEEPQRADFVHHRKTAT